MGQRKKSWNGANNGTEKKERTVKQRKGGTKRTMEQRKSGTKRSMKERKVGTERAVKQIINRTERTSETKEQQEEHKAS